MIDSREVDVPEGTTVLAAARRVGIDVPTLCCADGYRHNTSCFVCVVKIEGRAGLVPACATPVTDGMVITSETDAVQQARRMAVELLLSDHVGDCVGPCSRACPAGLDVADMCRHLRAGRAAEALELARRQLVLPGSLGRVCERFCERACRRADLDDPVAIGLLHRYVADAHGADDGCTPRVPDETGKRVAIVGAGPAGLSAAFHLRLNGHACMLFDERAEAGGMFRYDVPASRLPREVLDAEVDVIRRMGAQFHMGCGVGRDKGLDELRDEFDGVVLADHEVQGPDPDLGPDLVVARSNAVRGPGHGVHAVAAGRAAAKSIDAYLAGRTLDGPKRRVHSSLGTLSDAERAVFHAGAHPAGRADPSQTDGGLTQSQAETEAARCLECDCRKKDACRLRDVATRLDARPSHYRGERRPFAREITHPDIVFEPGKCIQCGLCIQVAERAREDLGLAMIDRGFRVQPAVPFRESLREGLHIAARECAAVCPTGAISLVGERAD